MTLRSLFYYYYSFKEDVRYAKRWRSEIIRVSMQVAFGNTTQLNSSMLLLARSPIKATMILQVFCYVLPTVVLEYQA